jgi:DNA-binding response OmpR family regulator
MKSILLIDGCHTTAISLKEVLHRYGFHVETAENSGAVRNLTREAEFDLIVMEFNPFGSRVPIQSLGAEQLGEELGKGTALIRELRAWRVTSPILVYTSLRGELYETATLDAGADDYILKSDSCSILLARLHAHLRRRQRDFGTATGEDRRTAVGRYVIDRKTRILLSGDRPVQLSTNEVALLESLAANPYRIVSITETLDSVWGDAVGRSQQALMALIKRLRRKMEKHGMPDLVETVRGQGLRLSAVILPKFGSCPEKPKVSIQRQNSSSMTNQGVEFRKSVGQSA